MEKETHKKQIKWPVLITENNETGKFTAILKGVEGVVAQGNSLDDVMQELKISFEAMAEYFSQEEITKDEEDGENTTVGQKELFLELC